jgi:hypothetical protein
MRYSKGNAALLIAKLRVLGHDEPTFPVYESDRRCLFLKYCKFSALPPKEQKRNWKQFREIVDLLISGGSYTVEF